MQIFPYTHNLNMGTFLGIPYVLFHKNKYENTIEWHRYLFRGWAQKRTYSEAEGKRPESNMRLKTGSGDYERDRRPSEFSLKMGLFSTCATRPTDREAFQRLISFDPGYRSTNAFLVIRVWKPHSIKYRHFNVDSILGMNIHRRGHVAHAAWGASKMFRLRC